MVAEEDARRPMRQNKGTGNMDLNFLVGMVAAVGALVSAFYSRKTYLAQKSASSPSAVLGGNGVIVVSNPASHAVCIRQVRASRGILCEHFRAARRWQDLGEAFQANAVLAAHASLELSFAVKIEGVVYSVKPEIRSMQEAGEHIFEVVLEPTSPTLEG